jgi:hypothetical protein
MALSSSCRKDDSFDDDPGLRLLFSADTITFDTVFTSVGSATRRLMVRNPSDKDIVVSSIAVAGGAASRFRINVDGDASLSVKDLKIAADDSAFVFVKVTVDPNQTNTPLIITDSILFVTNGNRQQVQLVAWGQDAYFYKRAVLQADMTWTNDKPHVIYDYLVVDSLCVLTIMAGTQVHLHQGAILAVAVDGSLKVKGSEEHAVVFQGDRLEKEYQDIPGQWGRIWLSAGSIDNEIDYAILKNGQVGLHVDTLGNSANPTLRVSNTIIKDMSLAGMLLQGTHVEATNCVIGACGQYSVILNIGGTYNFRHCTIGNYWNYSVRQTPALVLNNYYIYEADTIARDLYGVYFGNCIIYGRNNEELVLDRTPRAQFNYTFENCLFKTEQSVTDPAHFTACIKNLDPKFRDAYLSDLRLSAGSPAIDAGSLTIALGVPTDILGVTRTSTPDLGAYEFVKEE